nr:MAG TPA: hypothetical protein [Crassvirales sp.]
MITFLANLIVAIGYLLIYALGVLLYFIVAFYLEYIDTDTSKNRKDRIESAIFHVKIEDYSLWAVTSWITAIPLMIYLIFVFINRITCSIIKKIIL